MASWLSAMTNARRCASVSFRNVGNIVFVGQPRSCFFSRKKPCQLFNIEADQTQIELGFPESLQLDAERLLIPSGTADGKLVIRNDQRATLRFRKVPEHDHGDFGHAV